MTWFNDEALLSLVIKHPRKPYFNMSTRALSTNISHWNPFVINSLYITILLRSRLAMTNIFKLCHREGKKGQLSLSSKCINIELSLPLFLFLQTFLYFLTLISPTISTFQILKQNTFTCLSFFIFNAHTLILLYTEPLTKPFI